MVTIATGPTPPRPSPFAALGRLGGSFLANRQARAAEEERLRQEAETLRPLIVGGGRPNPFTSAAAGTPPPDTEARMASRPDDGLTPPPPAASGSMRTGAQPAPRIQGPQPTLEDDRAALERAPGGLGEQFRRSSPEQQTAIIMSLRKQGVPVPDIIEMFGTEPTEFGFTNVPGVGLVRTDPSSGTAEVALGKPPEPNEFGFTNVDGVGLVRTDKRTGTAEVVMDSPTGEISTDQFLAGLFEEFRANEIDREELDMFVELVRNAKASGDAGGLSARARDLVFLNKRIRGETTGTPLDSLTPEQATGVQKLLVSEPGRYSLYKDGNGRLYVYDSQEPGSPTLVTDLPGLVEPGRGPEAGERSVVGDIANRGGELGFIGQFQSLGNIVLPEFGSQIPAPERAELRSNLISLRDQLTSVLRDNRRLLSVQVEDIRSQIPNPDTIFESAPNAIAKLLTLKSHLQEQRARVAEIANDPKVPPAEAAKAGSFARDLDGIILRLGVPQGMFGEATPQQSFTFASALTPRSASELDPQSAFQMVQTLTDEQIKSLDEDVLEILLPMVEGGQ